ncbi:MAG: DNA replication and repair protein RecF [Bacteroidales bacterium]|jgi:DNA replication and repair protein RecF|nr:DNA replication and repair protein RecF [Bacteroidales bacterium]
MFLEQLKLTDFKNYHEAEFEFCEKVNAVVGENGSGKTNLLDAIHYLSLTKSYFTPQDHFSVRFGSDFFAIHGKFVAFKDQTSIPISCTFKENGRKLMKTNNKECKLMADHIGLFPLIMISPYDNDIINNGSEVRRKFFDMIISQYDKNYLRNLMVYQKIIAQRNVVLKQMIEQRYYDAGLIKIYDEQLIEPGNEIFNKRKQYLEEIIPFFQNYYDILSESKEQVSVIYESGLLSRSFEEGLKENEPSDRKSGYTNFGVHKDDYLFLINGRSIKRFGSQGQQKCYSIALKLAQYDYIYTQKNIKPILLLDDIFDKLDAKRIEQLLGLMGKEHIGQVFISDNNELRIKEILNIHGITYKLLSITTT